MTSPFTELLVNNVPCGVLKVIATPLISSPLRRTAPNNSKLDISISPLLKRPVSIPSAPGKPLLKI